MRHKLRPISIMALTAVLCHGAASADNLILNCLRQRSFFERIKYVEPAHTLPRRLFSKQEMRQIKRNTRVLWEIMPQLNPQARAALLRPDILTVFLGVKQGYIALLEGEPETGLLGDELERIPKAVAAWKTFLITEKHIISLSELRKRLAKKKERDFLTNNGIVTANEAVYLRLENLDQLGNMLNPLFTKYYGRDMLESHQFHGFLIGYPLEDLNYIFAWLIESKTQRNRHIARSKYKLSLITLGGKDGKRMLARWDAALDYAYSAFQPTGALLGSVKKRPIDIMRGI